MDPIQGSQAPQGESSQKSQRLGKKSAEPARAKNCEHTTMPHNFMASLSEAEYTYKRPKFGDIVQGVVVRAAPHEVLV